MILPLSEMNQSEEAVTLEKKPTYEKSNDRNGIVQVTLKTSRGASARISLYGGQVLSWKTEQGEELLFTSSKATFKPPMAVRGGIPICFPQFGSRGLLEQHGFARNRMWTIEDQAPASPTNSNDEAFVDLLLKPSDDDMKIWPHRFEFRFRVSLTEGGNLKMLSRCRNSNGKPFSFSIAFRTYFSISDISEVRVEGLETLDYLDNLCERERFTEQGDALTFENEIDRVYLSSSDVVALFDHGRKRTLQIRKQGLPDVAVWNPWEKKAKALTDLGDEEYKQMLCVDGAAVEKPIALKPGEEWTDRSKWMWKNSTIRALKGSIKAKKQNSSKEPRKPRSESCCKLTQSRDGLLTRARDINKRIARDYYRDLPKDKVARWPPNSRARLSPLIARDSEMPAHHSCRHEDI